MVVHTYNFSILWGTEAGRLKVLGQPGVHNKILSQNREQKTVVVHACNPTYSGSRGKRLSETLRLALGKITRPCLKNN
jgi:hypothetical protein